MPTLLKTSGQCVCYAQKKNAPGPYEEDHWEILPGAMPKRPKHLHRTEKTEGRRVRLWRTEAIYLLKHIPAADAIDESVSKSERMRAEKLLKKFGRKADKVGCDKGA